MQIAISSNEVRLTHIHALKESFDALEGITIIEVPLHAVPKTPQEVADLILEDSRISTPQIGHNECPLHYRLEEFKDCLISGPKSTLELIDLSHRRHQAQDIVA